MLTEQDITRLIEAEKEVFATKDDIATLRFDFSTLGNAVDRFAKRVEVLSQEMVVQTHRLSRVESWVRTAASKIGVASKA